MTPEHCKKMVRLRIESNRRRFNEKFFSRVKKLSYSECWVWTGAISMQGYGLVTRDKKHTSSHRIAWELQYGPIPDGMCVCHHCDNRKCCNPNHLFLGTNEDNMRDMYQKNRHAKYKERKLTNAQVGNIVRQHTVEKISQRELASIYGVNRTTIARIIQGRIYKDA